MPRRPPLLALLVPALVLGLAGCLGDDDDGGGPGACDSSGGGVWDPTWADLECQVLDLVNQRRAAGGDCGSYGQFAPSAPLAMDAPLRQAARLHSQDMATRNYFSHDSPGGPNGDDLVARLAAAGFVGWTTIGENIAAGPTTAGAVMEGWMASDGHCSNILEPGYTLIGVGYAFDAASDYDVYWTQDFGAK